MLNQEIMSKIT